MDPTVYKRDKSRMPRSTTESPMSLFPEEDYPTSHPNCIEKGKFFGPFKF
jgi:hypothetical protein